MSNETEQAQQFLDQILKLKKSYLTCACVAGQECERCNFKDFLEEIARNCVFEKVDDLITVLGHIMTGKKTIQATVRVRLATQRWDSDGNETDEFGNKIDDEE